MARLTNVNTGVTVEVRDEKVEAMGSEWQPAKAAKAPAKKAAEAKQSK